MGRRAQPRKASKSHARKKEAPQEPSRFVVVDFSDANFELWLQSALRRVRPPRVRPA